MSTGKEIAMRGLDGRLKRHEHGFKIVAPFSEGRDCSPDGDVYRVASGILTLH